MFKIIYGIAFLVALLVAPPVFADDGIPDNCENFDTAYYRPNIFPRYEPQNQRLTLVDWKTGQVAAVLAESIGDTRIVGWSPDCRYLVTSAPPDRTYVLWDTIEVRQMLKMAHVRRLDWSPGGAYALLQTEDGAFLLNMVSFQTVQLTTDYNPVARQNFADIYWNTQENTLVAYRYGKEETVIYDLRTGQGHPRPPDKVSETSYFPLSPVPGGVIPCYQDEGGWRQADGIKVLLDRDNHQIVLRNADGSPEQVILSNLTGLRFQNDGWSATCRYYAFAQGDDRILNTYIWDVVERRIIRVFEDAHRIPHPFNWLPIEGYALIQTRNGAYLWRIADDQRMRLETGVDNTGRDAISNFHNWEWDAAHQQLLLVTINHSNGITTYDLNGKQIAFYELSAGDTPVSFISDAAYTWLAVYSSQTRIRNGGLELWNQITQQHLKLSHLGIWQGGSYNLAFSPDSRYFIYYHLGKLSVWDIRNITPDGSPNYRYTIQAPRWEGFHFVDAETIEFGSGLSRWNIVTGEQIGTAPLVTPNNAPPVAVSVENSPGGSNGYCNRNSSPSNAAHLTVKLNDQHRLVLWNWETRQEVMVLEKRVRHYSPDSWSPDCGYIAGSIENDIGWFTIIWDMTTGQRIYERQNYYWYGSVTWSPEGDYALINGQYLWNRQTGTEIRLARTSLGWPHGVAYWDYGRQQILMSGDGGAIAYDMNTGALRQVYTHIEDAPSAFKISDDHSHLIVYSTAFGYYSYQGVTIWDMNTLEQVSVNVQGASGNLRLSPDNRFLVSEGTVLRVWDLQNLPPRYQDRLPIYRIPLPYQRSYTWKFEDSTVIVITSEQETKRWDLLTGKQIPE